MGRSAPSFFLLQIFKNSDLRKTRFMFNTRCKKIRNLSVIWYSIKQVRITSHFGLLSVRTCEIFICDNWWFCLTAVVLCFYGSSLSFEIYQYRLTDWSNPKDNVCLRELVLIKCFIKRVLFKIRIWYCISIPNN